MDEFKCKCGIQTESNEALLRHWEEEYNKRNRHFHCGKCMLLFNTPGAMNAHDRKIHPVKQQICCPGCNEAFKLPGALVNHIEKNQCRRIGGQQMAERREEKLAFARELQRRHFGQDPGLEEQALKIHRVGKNKQGDFNFTRFVSTTVDGAYGNPTLSSLRPTAGAGVRPGPLSFQTLRTDSEFPPVGGGQGNAVSTRNIPNENSGNNPWGQKKNLFPYGPPPSRPTPEQLKSIQDPAKNKLTAWLEHHPQNPNFNVNLYYCQILKKYKCPIERCYKSFPSAHGLRAHLTSPTHTGSWKVQCPICMRWFDTTTALVQHAESPSLRCDIRKSDGFRHFLHQATAGIVDATGRNEDGTEKYEVTDQARSEWGLPEKGKDGIPGLESAMGSMSLEKSAESRNKFMDMKDDDELKEPAANW
ncbi:hypothetical protein QBC38DRAFT_480966 [Podospora fimiseda]|uniref:C2H2-type domain-containing protein n=1 Tax=Podospora fimiseda TaxID=252190 RepID=A0AAN7GWF6_9PEZI|nr:hypothetical protein QBC38DRAFT_480966 [Podospora fimiseda]